MCGEGQSSLMPHTVIDGHLCPCVVLGIYLHENFILIVERLPVFPIVEGCYPHYLLLLVDNGHGENILDHPPRVIQGPLLQEQREKGCFRCGLVRLGGGRPRFLCSQSLNTVSSLSLVCELYLHRLCVVVLWAGGSNFPTVANMKGT